MKQQTTKIYELDWSVCYKRVDLLIFNLVVFYLVSS